MESGNGHFSSVKKMDPFKGPCPHQSAPVETDESMTSSSLDLVWPPSCKQCTRQAETSNRPQNHDCEPIRGAVKAGQRRLAESCYQQESRADCSAAPEPCFTPQKHSGHMTPPRPAGVWPHGLRDQAPQYEWAHSVNHSRGFAGPSNWSKGCSVEEAECLEVPLPLMSAAEGHYPYFVPSQFPAAQRPALCKCSIIN
ncbi:putative adapter protein CIKS-like [Scophthalmus maximus]|uniref:Putative adapter protein CIKS-like n=1 Tax=Scophthalmus maximus TaxID=52904 RepID=A0A2U9CUP7_SCOMX|nr:putative adapter protein CIKS-like [Scophthalmus maximus]